MPNGMLAMENWESNATGSQVLTMFAKLKSRVDCLYNIRIGGSRVHVARSSLVATEVHILLTLCRQPFRAWWRLSEQPSKGCTDDLHLESLHLVLFLGAGLLRLSRDSAEMFRSSARAAGCAPTCRSVQVLRGRVDGKHGSQCNFATPDPRAVRGSSRQLDVGPVQDPSLRYVFIRI